MAQLVLEKYDDLAIYFAHCWSVVWLMSGCSGTFSGMTPLTFQDILEWLSQH